VALVEAVGAQRVATRRALKKSPAAPMRLSVRAPVRRGVEHEGEGGRATGAADCQRRHAVTESLNMSTEHHDLAEEGVVLADTDLLRSVGWAMIAAVAFAAVFSGVGVGARIGRAEQQQLAKTACMQRVHEQRGAA